MPKFHVTFTDDCGLIAVDIDADQFKESGNGDAIEFTSASTVVFWASMRSVLTIRRLDEPVDDPDA